MTTWRQDYLQAMSLDDLLNSLLAWHTCTIVFSSDGPAFREAPAWIAECKQEIARRVLEPTVVYAAGPKP